MSKQTIQTNSREECLMHRAIDYLILKRQWDEDLIEDSDASMNVQQWVNDSFPNNNYSISEDFIEGYRQIIFLDNNVSESIVILQAHYFEKILDEKTLMLDDTSFGHSLACFDIMKGQLNQDLKNSLDKRLIQLYQSKHGLENDRSKNLKSNMLSSLDVNAKMNITKDNLKVQGKKNDNRNNLEI